MTLYSRESLNARELSLDIISTGDHFWQTICSLVSLGRKFDFWGGISWFRWVCAWHKLLARVSLSCGNPMGILWLISVNIHYQVNREPFFMRGWNSSGSKVTFSLCSYFIFFSVHYSERLTRMCGKEPKPFGFHIKVCWVVSPSVPKMVKVSCRCQCHHVCLCNFLSCWAPKAWGN